MKNIGIRMANEMDVPIIMEIMHRAHAAMADPGAYITDDEAYITRLIRERGFALIAETDDGPVGFFMVCVPGGDEDNLGHYLELSEEALCQAAMMDSAAVLPECQGQGIMGRMFREAVRQSEGKFPILLGTVAEDNLPSRRNFEKRGFSVLMRVVKPGGQQRLLMGRIHRPENPAENKR